MNAIHWLWLGNDEVVSFKMNLFYKNTIVTNED